MPALGDIPQGSLCGRCEGNTVRQEFFKHQKDMTNPISDDELKDILGSTVKHDDNNKIITTLCMICTYTEEDQTNIGYLAGSSTGKSYIPLEIAIGYFRKEDLIILGYCSPTAFFHEYGTMLPDPSDTRDIEPEKKRKIIYVDLHQKLLIFLDQPHAKLLENLRPLLSHDQKEITVKISDRREKSGLRAKTVVIQGFPTVIFCSTNYKQNEQEKTRLLLLSPEQTQEKLRESIALKIEKESNREDYAKRVQDDPKRMFLSIRIDDIKLWKIAQIIIPEELRALIFDKFLEGHKFLQSRNQRDISRLLALIKGYALLNFHQRNPVENKEDGTNTITATLEDVEVGFKYYSTVSEANELGIPPEVYEVYLTFKQDMEVNKEGFTQKEFQIMYFRKYRKVLGRDKAADFIKTLEVSGLLQEQPNPNDKRSLNYVCAGVGCTQELPEVTECHYRYKIPTQSIELRSIIRSNYQKGSTSLEETNIPPPPPRAYTFGCDEEASS
jgi:hypothetical protein